MEQEIVQIIRDFVIKFSQEIHNSKEHKKIPRESWYFARQIVKAG